jgi:hypothetical protein
MLGIGIGIGIGATATGSAVDQPAVRRPSGFHHGL